MKRLAIAFLALTLLATPLAVEAQSVGRVYRIAYLGNSSAALETELVAAFRQGLRDLKYVEGQNIVIEYRWAEGRYDRFPALVAEAVHLRVDVIVTAGTPAILAAKEGRERSPLSWLQLAILSLPVWFRASRTPAGTSQGRPR